MSQVSQAMPGVSKVLVILAAAVQAAHAQSPEELKAAADKWMSKTSFKMAFASAASGWRSTFEFDRAAGMTDFVGGRGYCFSQKVPTKVSFNGQQLVVAFDFRKGCDAIEYRFNPITGAGEVFASPGGAELAKTQSTVALRE